MKILASAAAAVALLASSLPATAGHRHFSGGCFKEVYREEYVPGNRWRSGYVRTWTDRVSVPCYHGSRRHHHRYNPPVSSRPVPGEDDNSCIEGAVLGGIAGGGIGAAASRGNGRLLGIPLGIVGGALIGCQIDGG